MSYDELRNAQNQLLLELKDIGYKWDLKLTCSEDEKRTEQERVNAINNDFDANHGKLVALKADPKTALRGYFSLNAEAS